MPSRAYQEKLISLDLSTKQKLVEIQADKISLLKQTKLLGINRGYFYTTPVVNEKKIAIKKQIEKIFEEIPI